MVEEKEMYLRFQLDYFSHQFYSVQNSLSSNQSSILNLDEPLTLDTNKSSSVEITLTAILTKQNMFIRTKPLTNNRIIQHQLV